MQDAPGPEGPTDPNPPNPAGRGRGHVPLPMVVGVIVVALAVGAVIGLLITPNSDPSGPPTAGNQVPSFTMRRLSGHSSLRVPEDGGGNGRPAILLFFASWCVPCQHELPEVARTYHLQQEHHSPLTKVALIGIDANDPRTSALVFVQRSGVTFPVGIDPNYAIVSGKFAFPGLPETVVVSGAGKIEKIYRGAISPRAFVHWEKKLVAS